MGIPHQMLVVLSNQIIYAGWVLFQTWGNRINTYWALVWKSEGRRPSWKPRRGSEDNIKVDIKVMEWKAVDGIYLFRIDINGGLFWTRSWTIGPYKIPGFSELAEKLLAIQGGLKSIDLCSHFFIYWAIQPSINFPPLWNSKFHFRVKEADLKFVI